MRRFFFFVLAALLVLALTVPAAAAEVYEFEYMEMPVALSESFDFSEYDSMLVYEGIVPPGIYDGYVLIDDERGPFLVPIQLLFDQYNEDDDYWFCQTIIHFTLDDGQFSFPFVFVLKDDMTFAFVDDEGFSYSRLGLSLTPVTDLPPQGGLLGDVASFGSGVISQVGSIASVITNNPLILLTVGLLFIGGCVGITGRLFSRR